MSHPDFVPPPYPGQGGSPPGASGWTPQPQPVVPQPQSVVPQHEPVPAQHEPVLPQHESVPAQHERVLPQPQSVLPQHQSVPPQLQSVAPQSQSVAPQSQSVAPQSQSRTPSRGSLRAVAVAGWLVAGLVVALGSPVGLVWSPSTAVPGQPAPASPGAPQSGVAPASTGAPQSGGDPAGGPQAGTAPSGGPQAGTAPSGGPQSGPARPGGPQAGGPRTGPSPTVGVGRKSAVGAVLPDTLHGYARARVADKTTFDILRPDVAFYDVPGHANNRLGVGVTLTSQDARTLWDADQAAQSKQAFGDVLCSQRGLAITCTTQLLHGTLTSSAFGGNVPDLATLAAITSEAYAGLP